MPDGSPSSPTNSATAQHRGGAASRWAAGASGVRGLPGRAARFIFAGLLAPLNRAINDDMRRMEDLLRASDREWTIVRPAGLYRADRVTDYRCFTGHQPGVSTSVADLADALLREATRDDHASATVTVLTDEGRPPYLLLLARQASLHRT